jgi:hypothetical protein
MPFLNTGITATSIYIEGKSFNKVRLMCVLEQDKNLRAASDDKTGDDL